MKLKAALGFFTRLPVGRGSQVDSLAGLAAWLPAIGLIVGICVAAVMSAASFFFPPILCGVIGCAVWVAVTGGLHLDGVADCGDGLMVEAPPERRLEIMKDSRLGTFGGTALFFNLLLKTAALAVLASQNSLWYIFLACALAGMFARTSVFWAMRYPSARPGGMGDALREGTGKQYIWAGAAACLLAAVVAGAHGLLALAFAFIAAVVLLRMAVKRIGGVTGDVFGCLIETCEWAVLLAFCIGL